MTQKPVNFSRLEKKSPRKGVKKNRDANDSSG